MRVCEDTNHKPGHTQTYTDMHRNTCTYTQAKPQRHRGKSSHIHRHTKTHGRHKSNTCSQKTHMRHETHYYARETRDPRTRSHTHVALPQHTAQDLWLKTDTDVGIGGAFCVAVFQPFAVSSVLSFCRERMSAEWQSVQRRPRKSGIRDTSHWICGACSSTNFIFPQRRPTGPEQLQKVQLAEDGQRTGDACATQPKPAMPFAPAEDSSQPAVPRKAAPASAFPPPALEHSSSSPTFVPRRFTLHPSGHGAPRPISTPPRP